MPRPRARPERSSSGFVSPPLLLKVHTTFYPCLIGSVALFSPSPFCVVPLRCVGCGCSLVSQSPHSCCGSFSCFVLSSFSLFSCCFCPSSLVVFVCVCVLRCV